MKNTLKSSLLVAVVAIVASGCGNTTTPNTKKTTSSTSTTNTSTSNPTTSSDPGTVSGCDGVYNANASRCYFTELPKFILSGLSSTTPVNNVSLWSSENAAHRGATFDEANFASDGSFKVRFKPTGVSSGTSTQGKVCSTSMGYQFTKAKIHFMLRRKGQPFSTSYEAIANIDQYSTKLSLPTISGSSQYVLEVMGIETNHRCFHDGKKYVYGTPNASTITACNAGTYFGTMPLNEGGPTSCTAIKVEFSTDSTFDLP